jgi:hypothetical protein
MVNAKVVVEIDDNNVQQSDKHISEELESKVSPITNVCPPRPNDALHVPPSQPANSVSIELENNLIAGTSISPLDDTSLRQCPEYTAGEPESEVSQTLNVCPLRPNDAFHLPLSQPTNPGPMELESNFFAGTSTSPSPDLIREEITGQHRVNINLCK